jgi:hypothetical protein
MVASPYTALAASHVTRLGTAPFCLTTHTADNGRIIDDYWKRNIMTVESKYRVTAKRWCAEEPRPPLQATTACTNRLCGWAICSSRPRPRGWHPA